jgi:O-antigen/teichoic acid export membrane protein
MKAGARGPTSWRARSARDGLVLSAAMVLAGGLDYLTNVVAGRGLAPLEFGVFVTVMAVVQVLTLLSIALRMVVAFYTAALTAQPDAASLGGAFLRAAARWSLRWGLIATAVVGLVCPLIASALRLPGAWPLWAATPIVLLLFLRETAFGTLQGFQAFGALGGVQVVQAVLRVAATFALVQVAGTASAAIVAQPIAALACVALAATWLRVHVEWGPAGREVDRSALRPVSWRYAVATLVGLAVFGLLTNADALFVRRYFSPEVAGHYGPVVTLAKVSLFLPWAIGLVLFPKVARRRAAGRESRSLLLLALGAALAPGLALTAVYFLVPGWLVRTVFTGAYADPGIVLGLASLAATLYAGIHIWLNYALSLERESYVYALSAILAAQGMGMYVLGRQRLVQMTLVMVAAAIAGNVAGYATTRSAAVPATNGKGAEAVPS